MMSRPVTVMTVTILVVPPKTPRAVRPGPRPSIRGGWGRGSRRTSRAVGALTVRLHGMANAEQRPPMTVELVWDGDLRFTATAPENTVLFDSAGKAGVSPVQALVESLGACMGMDLAHFLEKSRVPA